MSTDTALQDDGLDDILSSHVIDHWRRSIGSDNADEEQPGVREEGSSPPAKAGRSWTLVRETTRKIIDEHHAKTFEEHQRVAAARRIIAMSKGNVRRLSLQVPVVRRNDMHCLGGRIRSSQPTHTGVQANITVLERLEGIRTGHKTNHTRADVVARSSMAMPLPMVEIDEKKPKRDIEG